MLLNGVLAARAASTACAYDVYLRRQEVARRAREAAEADLAQVGLEGGVLHRSPAERQRGVPGGPRSAPGGPG